jgi:hypothetical protein
MWRNLWSGHSRQWLRVGSILLILELWVRFLHPFHGDTGESLDIIFGSSAIACCVMSLITSFNKQHKPSAD